MTAFPPASNPKNPRHIGTDIEQGTKEYKGAHASGITDREGRKQAEKAHAKTLETETADLLGKQRAGLARRVSRPATPRISSRTTITTSSPVHK